MNPLSALYSAKRPIIIYGAGVHLAKAEKEALRLAKLLGVPIAPTWATLDMVQYWDQLNAGAFGTHGTRAANFAVQNADWILSVGSRLDSKATGTPPSSFAPNAVIFMVDIDQTEISKFDGMGVKVTGICMDAKEFLERTITQVEIESKKFAFPDFAAWRMKVCYWRERYPACPPEAQLEEKINPYYLCSRLNEFLWEGDTMLGDVGCSAAWITQAYKFGAQRYLQSFNNAPMGYAMSAAIGACLATGKRAIPIMGDGSIQMNIAEMATIIKHQLPIKILLFNNNGFSMIKQTQEQWFDGVYHATSPDGGVAVPNFVEIAKAYGFEIETLEYTKDVVSKLSKFFGNDRPGLLEVKIGEHFRVSPQVTFGHPNHDAHPLLPRVELAEQMYGVY